MKFLHAAFVAIFGLFAATSTSVLAQSSSAMCEYFNRSSDKMINGPCIVTQTSSQGDATYAIKVTIPSVEVEVRYLKNQGVYHRWTMNGASAAAYEINSSHICGFTDDLNVSLCILQGDAAKEAIAQNRFMQAPPSPAEKPFYVGRWYTDNQRVCRGRPGETEGLITYTEKKMFGFENACDISKATPAANRIELQLKCFAEGMSSNEREVVQLIRDGRLSRTTFDGPKPETFYYKRCP